MKGGKLGYMQHSTKTDILDHPIDQITHKHNNLNKMQLRMNQHENLAKPNLLHIFDITKNGIKTNATNLDNETKQMFEIINNFYTQILSGDKEKIQSNRYEMIEETEIDIQTNEVTKISYIIDTQKYAKSLSYDTTKSNSGFYLYSLCMAFNKFIDLQSKMQK